MGDVNDAPTADATAVIVAMERAALGRWCKGDPSGFLEISASDVVYFDPYLRSRLDGLDALSAYYESLRGKVSASRYELENPLIQVIGSVAVLTYNFTSWGGNEDAFRWNCTEVYRWSGGKWRIIQTHWSLNGGPGAA